MAVDAKHPDYKDRAPEWKLLRETARGETAVKEEGQEYLPMPSGFSTHADKGIAAYEAYKDRAQFPDYVEPSIRGMVGIIHKVEAQIELPASMEKITERATKDGLTLEAFHQRITTELLTTGRYGVLVDAAVEGSELPWLAGYTAEAIINWSPDRDLFVLDESGLELASDFEWNDVKQWRVLRLTNGVYGQEVHKGDEKTAATPSIRGGGQMKEIPFVVANATDLSLKLITPPLIGVSRAAKAQYQLSADYRWQLFMSGQETLFVINGEAPDVVGAGVVVSLTGKESATGTFSTPDAKYVGPSGTGIEAHKTAIDDQKEAAAQAGAKMFDTDSNSAESGDALKLRAAAQTATLVSIARASAALLEKSLRYVAMMTGADPSKVVVTPNLGFIDTKMTPTDAAALVKVWQGSAISKQTLYENLQKGEIASAERTFEQEQELIDAEEEKMGMNRSVDPITGLPIDPAKQGKTESKPTDGPSE